MRPVRKITAKEENFRLEPIPGTCLNAIRRDSVEPEPIGTIVLEAWRITGYDKDCDGSLMARLERIDRDGNPTGATRTHCGLYSEASLVVTPEELKAMFEGKQ